MAAFTLVSDSHKTQSALKAVFLFLSDFKNFGSVLPADKVTDFRYSDTECSFQIKGITPMTVRLSEKKEYDYILFSSDGLAKFNFNLRVLFNGVPEEPGTCSVELSGDLNPFILSMAEKPLAALINTMSARLGSLQL